MGQVQPANDQARRNEILLHAVVRPILKKGGVQFHLGPQFLEAVILKCVVPKVGAPDQVGIGNWKTNSESSLRIEVAEAFSVSYRRCDDGMQGAVFILPGRQTPA